MTKLARDQKINRKIIAIGVGIVFIALLLVCLMFRGYIRSDVYPALVSLRYKHSLINAYDNAEKELNFPLNTLNFEKQEKHGASCSLNSSHYLYIEVGCFISTVGETQIIDDRYTQANLVKLEQLELTLTQNHWQKTQYSNTPTTLTALLNSKDSSENNKHIRYDKDFNGNTCWLSITRFEYLFGVLSCDRTSTTTAGHR